MASVSNGDNGPAASALVGGGTGPGPLISQQMPGTVAAGGPAPPIADGQADGVPQQGARGRKRRRVAKGRSRDKRRSPSSGESSSDEEENGAQAEGRYWLRGAFVPALPPWVAERRADTKLFLEEESRSGSNIVPPSPHTDSDDPPGEHMLRKVRERALDGFYIDVFTLLKPDVVVPSTGSRYDRHSKKVPARERSFSNWLRGSLNSCGLSPLHTPRGGGTSLTI